jgi:hypothetical protein
VKDLAPYLGSVVMLGMCLLAVAVNSTVVADENPTGRQHVWLPAEGLAPGR